VVIASLARDRSSLAIANIVGAAVSNILGAFSLGLLFSRSGHEVQFDRSSRIYCLALLALTTFAAFVIHYQDRVVWTVSGSVLIVVFVVYVSLVAIAIGRGVLTAPEDSDSDSDSDSDTVSDSESDGSTIDNTPDTAASSNIESGIAPDEESPLISTTPHSRGAHQSRHSNRLLKHTYHIVLGFLAVSLAGYILSQAATNITDALGLSDVLFGVVILAVATTIPEKFIALISSRRGHVGILVANCVGSNIFLLSLCLGILMIDSQGHLDQGKVADVELFVLLGSTLWMTVTAWFGGGGGSRWIGGIMLLAYLGFIVLEFTLVHHASS